MVKVDRSFLHRARCPTDLFGPSAVYRLPRGVPIQLLAGAFFVLHRIRSLIVRRILCGGSSLRLFYKGRRAVDNDRGVNDPSVVICFVNCYLLACDVKDNVIWISRVAPTSHPTKGRRFIAAQGFHFHYFTPSGATRKHLCGSLPCRWLANEFMSDVACIVHQACVSTYAQPSVGEVGGRLIKPVDGYDIRETRGTLCHLSLSAVGRIRIGLQGAYLRGVFRYASCYARSKSSFRFLRLHLVRALRPRTRPLRSPHPRLPRGALLHVFQ